MRWRIESGPKQLDDNTWKCTIGRGRRLREMRAYVSSDAAELRGVTQQSLALDLITRHLRDRVPPDEVSLALGWNFERQNPVVAEMGFSNLQGFRMGWMDLARRLNLPHWLQPRL